MLDHLPGEASWFRATGRLGTFARCTTAVGVSVDSDFRWRGLPLGIYPDGLRVLHERATAEQGRQDWGRAASGRIVVGLSSLAVHSRESLLFAGRVSSPARLQPQ